MFANIYKGRRVLITGHTGFKGSWLALWLRSLGAQVSGYSLYVPSQPSMFEASGLGSLCDSVEGDIRSYDELRRVHDRVRPEIIFHLAARAIVRDCYDAPREAFNTNLGGTVNILELCRQSSSVKSAVLITSDKCYDNVEWEYGYRETDRLGGKDPYSASKACAELAFRSYFHSWFGHSDSPGICTVRAGNVIGGGDWAPHRIIPDCIRAWSRGKKALIRSPQATRPWQHVLEPLSGYLWLGARLWQDKGRFTGESFNFGPPSMVNAPVSEVLSTLRKHWPEAAWETQDSGKTSEKKEATLLKLCGDKAAGWLGWHAVLTFEETMEMTARWYQTYLKNPASMYEFTQEQIQRYQSLAGERTAPWI